jgi:hypothetical protein
MTEKTQENTTFVVNVTSKPNSHEFGSIRNIHKVYYDKPEELLEHINKLKELGLYKEE